MSTRKDVYLTALDVYKGREIANNGNDVTVQIEQQPRDHDTIRNFCGFIQNMMVADICIFAASYDREGVNEVVLWWDDIYGRE